MNLNHNRSKKFWWLIPLFLFDLCYYFFILYLIENRGEGTMGSFRMEGAIFLFLISLFSIYCVRLAQRLIGERFQQRLILKFLMVLLLSILVFLGTVMLIQYGLELSAGQQRSSEYYLNNMILLGFLHLLVGNAAVGVAYFREVDLLKTRLVQKDQKQVEMELQMLRQQMSPHFLFNNLNTLTSLIGQDVAIAKEYSNRMAALYRYSTRVTREELVTLEEELNFALDYFRLIQLRFGEVYQLSMDKESILQPNWLVVPMSMQTLLENVIKHNAGSSDKPLKVEIWIEDDCLHLSNALRLKDDQVDGLGVGLENLKTQYQLITKKSLSFEQTANSFTVKLPLIKNNRYEDPDHRR